MYNFNPVMYNWCDSRPEALNESRKKQEIVESSISLFILLYVINRVSIMKWQY